MSESFVAGGAGGLIFDVGEEGRVGVNLLSQQ